jgi:hypothetical protein
MGLVAARTTLVGMDRYELGRYPRVDQLPRLLLRPSGPVVMVNLIAFKAAASGAYEGLTGREAYQDYVQGVVAAQRSMGSRLLWSGECRDRLSPHGPDLDVIAFLEYASPTAFLRFARTGGGKADARAAGLDGQWLVAATTLHEAPAAEGPVLVQLLPDPALPDPGTAAPSGGRRIWRGSFDQLIIGRGHPFAAVEATVYPDRSGLLRAARMAPEGSWLYSAETTDLLPGLSG